MANLCPSIRYINDEYREDFWICRDSISGGIIKWEEKKENVKVSEKIAENERHRRIIVPLEWLTDAPKPYDYFQQIISVINDFSPAYTCLAESFSVIRRQSLPRCALLFSCWEMIGNSLLNLG